MEFCTKPLIQENEKHVFAFDWFGPHYEFYKIRTIFIALDRINNSNYYAYFNDFYIENELKKRFSKK